MQIQFSHDIPPGESTTFPIGHFILCLLIFRIVGSCLKTLFFCQIQAFPLNSISAKLSAPESGLRCPYSGRQFCICQFSVNCSFIGAGNLANSQWSSGQVIPGYKRQNPGNSNSAYSGQGCPILVGYKFASYSIWLIISRKSSSSPFRFWDSLEYSGF